METQATPRGWTPARLVFMSIAGILFVLLGLKQMWLGHIDAMTVVGMVLMLGTIGFTARDARQHWTDI